MRFFKLLTILLFLCSCFNLQLKTTNKEKNLSSKIVKELALKKNKTSETDHKTFNSKEKIKSLLTDLEYPAKIVKIIWNDFSLMDIKLIATDQSKPKYNHFTLKDVQKKLGATTIKKENFFEGSGNSVCYKDNKRNTVIKFEESLVHKSDLYSYTVSQEKELSNYTNCLSTGLKNIQTKSGLKIGISKQDVEKIFSVEPFKSAKKFNSDRDIINNMHRFHYPCTYKLVKKDQLTYEAHWLEFNKKNLEHMSITITIDIHFKFDKVSSFEVSAVQQDSYSFTNLKYPSKIVKIIWNDFSLIGIKLIATDYSKPRDKDDPFTLKDVQKKLGKAKIVTIKKEHHEDNSICYKDNKRNIMIKFEESWINEPNLSSYRVSKEKDVSKYTDCLSIELENVKTKSGLKIGMNRQEVEKIFSVEPFKSAKKFNSQKEVDNYIFNTSQYTYKLVKNNQIQYSTDWGEVDTKNRIQLSISIFIEIQFQFDKVSSFEVTAFQEG